MNEPVYVAPRRKRIPYGMKNFADIRRDNYYYVDKTHFIPQIEQANRFFFFIRPRRFGKSLTLSVLQHYYDIRTRDDFEVLFDDLYIGQHSTPDRNSYLVLKLNFSGISGELNDYRKGLDAHCGTAFENFCHIYADLLPPNTLEGLRRYTEKLPEENYRYHFLNKVKEGTSYSNSKKLCMLSGKDQEFTHGASAIQTIVSQGSISGELKDGFPTADITLRDNFNSLLYYFGMLTISGTHKGRARLTIPNIVVQEQLYTYLLTTYNDADLSFSSYEKSELASRLAYDGAWQPYFDYIADCLKRYASQRDKQKGEFFVHGFTLAMTAQNRFYRPISEQDTQAGYVDIFLCPLLENYPDMTHSYIVELKYAKYKDPETRVEELRQEAIAQANRYAESETVKRAVGGTQLHKVVVVYKGMEMRVCEEVSLTNTIGGNPL